MSEKPTQMTSVSAFVPEDLAEAFKKLASEQERSFSAALRIAMREYLEAEKEHAAA